MLRDDLKCPVCGESEIVCELSGCDRIADVALEEKTDVLPFVLVHGIGEPPPIQFSSN